MKHKASHSYASPIRAFCFFCLISFSIGATAQERQPLYNPTADAAQDLAEALLLARQQHKHVLVQVGGNWCPWCYRLHDFILSDPKVDSLVKADYILVRINYSPENRNYPILARLGYPQRFGFPVLLVLDQEGVRLHTQDTALLEQGESYDEEKLLSFLRHWNVEALDPAAY